MMTNIENNAEMHPKLEKQFIALFGNKTKTDKPT